MLAGDAACFVDPVLSSGVHLATYSALLAARAINSSLAGDVPEDRAFAEFENRYRREYGLFYEFLVSFYDIHQDERSYFWKAKKITNVADGELESFVELVGGFVSGDSALVSAAMSPAGWRRHRPTWRPSLPGTPAATTAGTPSMSQSRSGTSSGRAPRSGSGTLRPGLRWTEGALIPSDGLSWVAGYPGAETSQARMASAVVLARESISSRWFPGTSVTSYGRD